MLLDRIELADIGNPRKMAAGVLGLLPKVEFPLPIEEIALALEIRQIIEFETQAFEGALLTDEAKSDCTVVVRRGLRPERRRFTVGHELGHYLMPLHIPVGDGFRCTSADFRQEELPSVRGKAAWEAEANTFAAELLMPSAEFKKRLRATSGASLEALVSLGNDFGVSKTAGGRRMTQLADDPCALIVSKDGVIKQIYRHNDFPFVRLKLGMPVPRDAVIRSFREPKDSISGIEETDPAGWQIRERRGLEVYEQVLTQGEGWGITLLTAEMEDEDFDE